MNNSTDDKIRLVLNIWDYDSEDAYICEGAKPNFEALEKELNQTGQGSSTLRKFGFSKGEWCDPYDTEEKKDGFVCSFGNGWTGKRIFQTT